jgi:2'-5' RNA ligase
LEQIRTFIAIELPRELKDIIKFYQKELGKRAPNIRWIILDNIHITLKFLGAVNADVLKVAERSLVDVSRETGVFSITTKQLGGFPNLKKPRVIWVGIESNTDLIKMQIRIEEALDHVGFARETRKFSPHITFGRIKYPEYLSSLNEFVVNNPLAPFEMNVKEFVLMRSSLNPQGAVYTPIRSYSLDINHK